VRAVPLAPTSEAADSVRPSSPVQLRLPPGGLACTQAELRALSGGVREALVLWAGQVNPDGEAEVTDLLSLDCPATDLRLVVPLPERLEALEFVRKSGLLIFADLHTHPDTAFLSDADRARPFGSKAGFYAIVVPNFAVGDPLDGWAMYEANAGEWIAVNPHERIAG
jgi:hypothetical protein